MTPPPETEPSPDAAPAPVVFRSSKKRKANLRQRAPSDLPSDDTTLPEAPPAQTVDELIASASEPSISSALRLRAQHRRPRHKGVGFTSSEQSPAPSSTAERSLIPATQQPPEDPLGGMTTRFAPQTGLTSQLVNKHMMEYIESKLSTSSRPSSEPESQSQSQSTTKRPPVASPPGGPILGSAVLQGKLMEIDLGEEARARNIALTERARRLVDPSAPVSTPETAVQDPSRPAKKPRLDKDGKPWRPRNRRGSQDIARDRLVEEILHESRLDVYEPLPDEEPAPADEDTTADDRLAEEFQREFLDAMALRRQQHAAAVAQRKRNAILAGGTGTRAGPEEDVLRGPKLGGSRSQRSAMRDILLAKEKEKIKSQRR